MDGDVDYSKYSRAQLEEVSAHIDAEKYPRNFANLQRELNARPPESTAATPWRVPFRAFAVWPVAWVAAACGPPAILFDYPATSSNSYMWVAIPGFIAWSAYLGFKYRSRGDTVGFMLAAAVPLGLLALSSVLALSVMLARR